MTCNNFYTDVVPHILTHPTDTSASVPFSGVFTCSVTGCGHLNITWYKRGGSLPTKSESTEVSSPTFTNSTLVIPNVTSDDVGRYYCLVWANRRGTQSNDGILYFAGDDIYNCNHAECRNCYIEFKECNMLDNCGPLSDNPTGLHFKMKYVYHTV